MQNFILSLADGQQRDQLWDGIHGRGAFRTFRVLADNFGLTDKWYEYQADAYREIAEEWCRDHDIEFTWYVDLMVSEVISREIINENH